MNWKAIAVIIGIIVFIFAGGIGLSKSALSTAKTDLKALSSKFSGFVQKQTQSPTDQQNAMPTTSTTSTSTTTGASS